MTIDLGALDYHWFGIFVAVNTSLLIVLAMNISRLRIQLKLPYGDGDNKELKQAIRVHMNGVEHVPLFGLLVLALTVFKASPAILGVLVVSFSIARLAHAYGMLARHFNMRRLGAMLTYLLQIWALVVLLARL